ncbi:MAG: efflux RND transporter permease subunit [Candidatus Omnitrophica bacterium]|nr:efflux RND transporter permease subunit [Candidatus Omnitrophota bacterium]MCM8798777.1 efflux RND transporter permease subunit [Candidatus Omnitrophota bacterium]
MNLPEFGVRRPVTNLMIFTGIIFVSLYSLFHLGIDQMPEIEPPAISIISAYPGASPEDVEIKVTEPLENQLATTPGLEKITSVSAEGVSVITLKFVWGTNLDTASNDIRDRIELAKRFLPDIPDEMENPFIFKFNTAMMPILFIGINAQQSYPELYDLIDKKVADPIRQLAGVGTVQLFGGLERQINVWIERARLEGYGFSILDILNALRKENVTQPVGNLKSGLTSYLIRLPGEFSSPEELNLVILGKKENKVIYLKDVARVEDSFKEVTMEARINRKPGIMMMIQKQTGTNTVEVARRIKNLLRRLENTLPRDIKLNIIFDTSQDIINALSSLKTTLYRGIFFVILVVWFFLRELRTSLIIALTIPFSLLIAFIYLFLSGRTLNIVSLSSLVIACGMVVDNAIVIVDNIWRHIEKRERLREAAIFGAEEMFLAITASTFTTIVVFLPFLFMRGIIGIMFGELAIVVTVTLLASLFTASTFSPMLCAKILRERSQNNDTKEHRFKGIKKIYETSERWFKALENFYSSLLSFSLRNKRLIIFGFSLLFILSLFLLHFVGNEFIPEEDTGDVRTTIHLPLGTRFEETRKVALRVEEIFEKNVPEKRIIFARPGTTSSMGRAFRAAGESGENIIVAGAKLIPKTRRNRSVFEIGQVLRREIGKIPGVLKIDISTGNPIGRMITGMGGKAIQVEIIGHSFEETNVLAEKLKSIIEKIPGAVDVSISREISQPELRIAVDREKAAILGLNMQTIASSLKTYIEGSTATKYREKGETYDIYVRLEENSRTKIEDIENLSIVSPLTGKSIRLINLAKVYETAGPVDIERVNRERVVKVECNVFGRSTGKVREDIEKNLKKIVIPSDIRINFGGEVEEQKKAFRDLTVLLILGIFLVYMIMAGQFESLLAPFVIMFSVPFTFSGVFLGFWLTKTTLNIISFLGIIMLVGIVVNNAIVLISYINILRKRGLVMHTAITQAGRERLRPVLMTTLTTLAGLFPMAVFKGEGSEIWQPLGITMIGGLAVSTFVTLVFVPTLYAVLETKIKNRKEKQR